MIDVVAAVICRSDKFLIARRRRGKSLAGKWEFPGGKVENGEDAKQALRREILEELGIDITVGEELTTVEHRYDNFAIRLQAFLATTEQSPFSSTDHDSLDWVTISAMREYDLAEADLPVIDLLEIKFEDSPRGS